MDLDLARRRAWLVGLLAALPLAAVSAPRAGSRARRLPEAAAPRYGRRADVLALADGIAERRGFDTAWLRRHLAQARRLAQVQQLVMPPPVGTAKNWRAYRERFIRPARIDAGLAFWRAHEPWLERAEEHFGVPAAVVVGIVGVETFYGRVMGEFRVIDSLATLSLDFPSGRSDRSAFFRDELEEFFAWCVAEGLDPLQPRGSYAGAIGLPQFMPSSINRHAIDFDNDGRIDLRASGADAVGSVARYLSRFGWVRGMPTHFAVEPPPPGSARDELLAPDIVPRFSATQLAERGARLAPAAEAHPGPLALVELQNGDGPPSHVAGTANFYAITRYNWSSYYAMAVISLAEAVAEARDGAR